MRMKRAQALAQPPTPAQTLAANDLVEAHVGLVKVLAARLARRVP